MPSFFRLLLTAPMAVLLVFAGPAQADRHQLTTEEVEAYFQQVQQEATEIVQADELHRIVEWIERNIADGAQFQVSMNLIRGDQRKGFAALTLDKDDMLQMGGLFVAAFQQQGIEDYALEVAVADVTAHGPGAATVRTTWTESFVLSVPQGEGTEAAPEDGTLRVEGIADCVQVVQRDGDRLVMGLMTCTAEMRL